MGEPGGLQSLDSQRVGHDGATNTFTLGFSGGSVCKESACNAGEPRLIFLGQEDPLEEGMATHPSILAWRIPMDRGAWWAAVHGVAKSWT